jgi:polyhydroxyalkanoate synthesis regulator phasin
MPMSIEDRKIYNEKYYTDNKKRIADMLLVKIECPHCSKHISKANLERHKIGNSCRKNQLAKKSELSEMKEQIERLSNEIKELKSQNNI